MNNGNEDINDFLSDINNVNVADKWDNECDSVVDIVDNEEKKTEIAEVKKKAHHNGKGLATVDTNEVLSPEEFNEELTRNLQNDYRYSREKVKDMIDRIGKVYSMAIEESLSTGDAKQVASLSSLFKSIIDGSTKLVELSNKYKDTIVDNIDPDIDASPEVQTNIQNNYYGDKSFESIIQQMQIKNSIEDRFKD